MKWAILTAACAVIAFASAHADDALMSPEKPGGAVEITGGRPATPEEWKASFHYQYNGSECSATAIGSRTLLTAAHCLGESLLDDVKVAGTEIKSCKLHPKFPADHSFDFALCLTKDEMRIDDGFERLAADASFSTPGTPLLLQGYGCTQAGPGGVVGVLYLGDATVRAADSNDDYIVTTGAAAVCSGDSGGAAFRQIDRYRRVIVGVNSKGLINTFSYLAPIARKEGIVAFFTDWSRAHNICGMNEVSEKCHD